MVQTRSQRCRKAFQETIENPCVLFLIASKLEPVDLVHFKQISKDIRFNDVIDHRLTEIHEEKVRRKEVIENLTKRISVLPDIESGMARIPTIVDVYNIVCDNKWLLDFERLKAKIYEKLIEFTKDPFFRDHGIRYFTPLFGLKTPQTYYNSRNQRAQFGTFDQNGTFILLE